MDSRNMVGYTIRCDVTGAPDTSSDLIRYTYNNEVHDEFNIPGYMNGVSDGAVTINPVPYLSTCGLKKISVEIYALSQVCSAQEFIISFVFEDGSCTSDVSAPTKAPTPPLTSPINNINNYVCSNSYTCPTTSYRIPGRYCYDTFDDCQCISGYVKDNTKKHCIQIPTNSPTNAPSPSTSNIPSLRPTILPSTRPAKTPVVAPINVVLPPTTIPTKRIGYMCTKSFKCPSDSYRIPGRNCYDTIDDCQCITGHVKVEKKCIPIPKKPSKSASRSDDDDDEDEDDDDDDA